MYIRNTAITVLRSHSHDKLHNIAYTSSDDGRFRSSTIEDVPCTKGAELVRPTIEHALCTQEAGLGA